MLVPDLDQQRRDREDDAAAQVEAAAHASLAPAPAGPVAAAATIPSQTSSIVARLRGRDHLLVGVDLVGAVREEDAVVAVAAEGVGVAATADRHPGRLQAGAAQPGLGAGQRRRVLRQLIAAEQLFEPHVDVAAVLAGTPGTGVRHLPGDLGGPLGVEAAGLGVDPAVARDDVAGGAAGDQADVRRRPLVEPAQLHPRDRGRGGGDRAGAVLGPDPGVGLGAGEVGQQLLLGRRPHDHLADRAGVVEDEPDRRPQGRDVEGLGAAQALLLGHRQHQLDPDRRRRFGGPGDQLHEDRDRGLVVGTQDRLAAAAEDALLLDHLDLPPVGNRVQVGAEHHPLVALARQPRQQVSGARFGRPGGVVLGDLHPQRSQLGGDGVGDLALLAGRAADLAEPREGLEESGVPLHGTQG